MDLTALLKRDANNLDLFRIIAACMVIYGHAYALTPEIGHQDWLKTHVGFDYTASLAVKIFFFISGLVVTNSLLARKSAIPFVVARAFRIWPAMIVVILSCALIIGPIYTPVTLRDYIYSNETWSYVFRNFILDPRYELPGVFDDLPFKGAINGSLWTLPYEVAAYLALLGIFLLGVLRQRWLATLLLITIIVDPLFGNKLLVTWLTSDLNRTMLAPCFAFGALLALHRKNITINGGMAVGSWLLYFIFRDATAAHYFFYLAIFLTILFLSGTHLLMALKPSSDISYGIYLWGFPTQQILAHHFLHLGIRFNQVAAIFISIILGYLSWQLVEKRAIKFGRFLTQHLNDPVELMVAEHNAYTPGTPGETQRPD